MDTTSIGETLPWISSGDIDLCLKSSDRLSKDADRASLPTRVALLELSLEELGKGAILGLLLLTKRVLPWLAGPEQPLYSDVARMYRQVISPKLRAELSSILDPVFSSSFQGDVEAAFRDHRVKLEYVDRLNRLIATVMSAFQEHPEFMNVTMKEYERIRGRWRTLLYGEMMRRGGKRFAKLHSEAVIPDEGELIRLKKEGLYVGLGTDRCLEPRGLASDVKALRKLIGTTRVTVSAMAVLLGRPDLLPGLGHQTSTSLADR